MKKMLCSVLPLCLLAGAAQAGQNALSKYRQQIDPAEHARIVRDINDLQERVLYEAELMSARAQSEVSPAQVDAQEVESSVEEDGTGDAFMRHWPRVQ